MWWLLDPALPAGTPEAAPAVVSIRLPCTGPACLGISLTEGAS